MEHSPEKNIKMGDCIPPYECKGFEIFDDYIDTSERVWIIEDKGGEDAIKERQVKEDNF